MNRITQLDGLRGFFILLITVNHIENPLNRYTQQPFGYASAAEGFVFVSGLVAGLVYNRKLDRMGAARLKSDILARTRKIYLYHLAVLLVACAAIYFSPIHQHHWQPVFHRFLNQPAQALALGAALLYQPDFHDILPLYCIFLLFVPLLMRQFRQNRAVLVFGVSIGLWAVSQVGFGFSFKMHNAVSPYFPGFELGNMDMFAWQLLFVAGVYVASRRYSGNEIRISASALWLCLPLITILILHRHHVWMYESPVTTNLFDKQRLGILRLANFASLVVVVSLLMKRFPSSFSQPWLVVMGKHSLPVFSMHILLIFLLQPPVAYYSHKDPAVAVLFAAFVAACLYLTARWREKGVETRKNALAAQAKPESGGLCVQEPVPK